MKKVGKTTRPFRYDLNKIPYDYTVEVRNRFKGLDLIDRVPDELWNEVRDVVQETGIKTIPMEKKCKRAKMAVWGGLTNSCEKKRREKERKVKSLSRVRLFVTSCSPWNSAFPFSRDLPNTGIKPRSPALWANSLPAEP